jgi:dTDP-4-dehydrorhamnose reductase
MRREPLTIPETRLPLLITGITGVAGYNALHYFQRKYPGQVVGIRPCVTDTLRGDGILAVDTDDAASLRELFRCYGFRSVLNATGNCALKACELDPDMAHRINVTSAEVLTNQVRAGGCRLVHLSSDLVFSGTRGGQHVETDKVDPVSVYGKTMVRAERVVAAADPGAAMLRISLPMGPSFNRHAGAIDWIESRFRKGRPATLYFDEVRSCTYCDDLNWVFEWFLAGADRGIFHLGGPWPLTLYQIAQVVNRAGGYGPDLLHGCPRVRAGPLPPRAGNVSMCSDKLLRVVGRQPFRPWPAAAELVPTDRQWHHRRDPDESGSRQRIVQHLYHGGTAPVAGPPVNAAIPG